MDLLNNPAEVIVPRTMFEALYQQVWDFYVADKRLDDGVTYIYRIELTESSGGKRELHVHLRQLKSPHTGEVVITEE